MPSSSKVNAATRPKILLDPYPRPVDLIFDAATKQRLESLGNVIWHDGPAADDALIERHLPDTSFLIGQSALPRERLDRAPLLRGVFNVESNFLPNVDYAECARRNIPVLSTAPVFAQPVAEMALGLALSAARRIHEADAAIRSGGESLYGTEDNRDSILIRGKPVALVGCGNLGRALLPLLRPFGGEILAHDPWIDPSVFRQMGLTPVDLDTCFSRAAAVFLLAAPTLENAGKIGRAQFERMVPGGIVVLVSRAGIVQFDELLDAAAAGRIRAAIDVWPDEPIPADHRARKTPNTVLQAHRAGNVPEIWPEMGRLVVQDIERILAGMPPEHCQRARLETVTQLRSKPVG